MGSGRPYGRDRELAELRSAARADQRRILWICGAPAVGKSRLASELVLDGAHPSSRILIVPLRDVSSDELGGRLVGSLPAVPSNVDAPLERFALACAAHAIEAVVLDDADVVGPTLPELALRLLGLAPSLRVIVTARAAPKTFGALVVRLAPLEPAAANDLARYVLESLSTTPVSDDDLAEVTGAADGLPGAIVEAANVRATTAPGLVASAFLEPHLLSSWSRLAEDARLLLAAAARFGGSIDTGRLELVAALGDGYDATFEAAVRDGWLEGDRERGLHRMLRPARCFVRRRTGCERRREFARVVESSTSRVLGWTSLEACAAALDAIARDAANLNAAVVAGGLEEPCETALRALGELAFARKSALSSHDAFSVEWAPKDHPLVVRRELIAAEIEIARGVAASALERLAALPSVPPDLVAERDVLVGHAHLQLGAIVRGSALLEPHRESVHLRAQVLDAVGYAAHLSGRLDEAAELYRRAEAERVAQGAFTRALRVRNRRAFLAMDQGRFDEAASLLESLLVQARALGMTILEGTVLGYLGNLARDRRYFGRARDRYREARAVLRRAGETKFERTFAMDEAVLELLCHRPRSAVAILAPIASDPVLRTVGRLSTLVGCYLLIGRAMLGEAASDVELALADAREDQGLVGIHRLAVRAQAIARGEAKGRRSARASAPSKVVSTHTVIAQELIARLELSGRWDQTDVAISRADGERVWLAGKDVSDKVLGKQLRIVLRLLRTRIENPGATLSSSALIEAAWPSDRGSRAAAENRLRVALSALRRAGLARVLERTPDGYRLAESTRIALLAVDVDEPSEPSSN
jgi:tetratricopeptide (TPR) repeat protein